MHRPGFFVVVALVVVNAFVVDAVVEVVLVVASDVIKVVEEVVVIVVHRGFHRSSWFPRDRSRRDFRCGRHLGRRRDCRYDHRRGRRSCPRRPSVSDASFSTLTLDTALG